MKAFATFVACTALHCSLFSAPATAADDWIVLSHDLTAFQPPTGQWYIAGGARMNPNFLRRLVGDPGQGTLINGKIGVTNNLVTREQWGDVEIKLEFMIPRGSNSGVKLHGVYEVQIFDSWKVAKPTGADCGGIYPRGAETLLPPRRRGYRPAAQCGQGAGPVANPGRSRSAPALSTRTDTRSPTPDSRKCS